MEAELDRALAALVAEGGGDVEAQSRRLWALLLPWIGRAPREGADCAPILDKLEALRARWYGAHQDAFLVWREMRANDLGAVRASFHSVAAAMAPLYWMAERYHPLCAHFLRTARIMAEEGHLDPDAGAELLLMVQRLGGPGAFPTPRERADAEFLVSYVFPVWEESE